MIGEPSIRLRLGVGLAVAILLMWLAATVVAGFVIRQELDEAYDSALQETAQRLLALAGSEVVGHLDPAGARRVAALEDHDEFLTYRFRDRDGRILLESHDAEDGTFDGPPVMGFATTASHRIYGEAVRGGALVIEIAEPLAHRNEAAAEASVGLLVPLPLLVPASLFGVWWFVRRSMRPLLTLDAEIESRDQGDLAPVTVEGLPVELRPISQAVNRLMSRLSRALDAERNFAANSAHELRTPIAGALAQTQRLIADTAPGTNHARAVQIEKSLRHLAGLSEKLLQLARADAGLAVAATTLDLVPVLTHVVDEFRREAAAIPRVHFESAEPSRLRARIDLDAFAILMRNLIENALKHSPPDSPVDVAIETDGTIRIVNGGPAVPADSLVRLRSRFSRGATAATGVGLGLSIVDAIARGAGLRVDLVSPATGRSDGFEAIVAFDVDTSTAGVRSSTELARRDRQLDEI